ncbi:MAG: hypothetical protein HYT73_05170 [Candidatus Aenigmarchaeota archaeon]|nr:hypothetical protein [Candidatus Aenigmarchaeota archaeon]
MGIGSYARFALGIILSLEIIRSFLTDGRVSSLALVLSVIFIIMALLFFVKRI